MTAKRHWIMFLTRADAYIAVVATLTLIAVLVQIILLLLGVG